MVDVGECVDVERVPVTQEHLVEMIVGDSEIFTKSMLERSLYFSIHRMVKKIAYGYSINSVVDGPKDLEQDCMQRIMNSLHSYNPKKAKFTTWSYRVCRSVCDRRFLTSSKIKRHFVRMADNWEEPEDEKVTSSVVCSEVVEVIRDLFEEFPKKQNILLAMFGNPYKEGYIMPDSIDVSETAKKSGMNYSQTHAFYSRKVKPFFKNRFSREDFHARS